MKPGYRSWLSDYVRGWIILCLNPGRDKSIYFLQNLQTESADHLLPNWLKTGGKEFLGGEPAGA